jgi:hypothetical protein
MSRERFFSKTKLAEAPRPGMDTPCLEWQAGCDRFGYGRLKRASKREYAHRIAWKFANGPIPSGLYVLHKCDNPPCVNSDHLFLGTIADNNADMVAKGRNSRGNLHYSRLRPERLARGDAHGSRLHPELRPRGDNHPARMHPERLARGEKHGGAVLNNGNVCFIFQLHAQGWSQRRIAAEFGVSQSVIWAVLSRKNWAHVDLGKCESSL